MMDDKPNTHKSGDLKEIARHFEKMSNAIHHFTEVYKENMHRLPFWKTKTFWSLVVVVSSLAVVFSSLYYTSRDALSLMKAYSIQKKINLIRDFKAHENKAIVTARMTIINQTLACPVTDIQQLKQMKIDRNKTLIDIAAYNSRLNVDKDRAIKAPISKIVKKIYNMDLYDICRIKPNRFDRDMQNKLIRLDNIINRILLDQEKQIRNLEF